MSEILQGEDPQYHRKQQTVLRKVGGVLQEVAVTKLSAEDEEGMILAGLDDVPVAGGNGFSQFLAKAAKRADDPNAGVTQGFIDNMGVPHTGAETKGMNGSTGFADFLKSAEGKGDYQYTDNQASPPDSHGFGLSDGVDPNREDRRREPSNDGGFNAVSAALGAAIDALTPHHPEDLNRNPHGKGESQETSTAAMGKEETLKKPSPEQVEEEKSQPSLLSRAERRRQRMADTNMVPDNTFEPIVETDTRDRQLHETVEDPVGRDIPEPENEKAVQIPPKQFDDEKSWPTPGFSQDSLDQSVKDTEIQASLRRIELVDGRVLIGKIASVDGPDVRFFGRVAGDRSDASFSFMTFDIKKNSPYRVRQAEQAPRNLDGAYAAFKKAGDTRPFVRKASARTAGVVGKLQAVPGGASMFVMDDAEGSGDYSYTYDIAQAKELNPQEQQEFLTYHENGELVPKTASRTADKIPGGLSEGMPDSKFDPKELSEGIPEEMREHTTDPDIAKEIVKDHLVENPHEYSEEKTASLQQFDKVKDPDGTDGEIIGVSQDDPDGDILYEVKYPDGKICEWVSDDLTKTAGEGTPGYDTISDDDMEVLQDVANQNSGGVDSDRLNELSNQGLVDYSPGVESTMEPGHWFLTPKGKAMLNKAASSRKVTAEDFQVGDKVHVFSDAQHQIGNYSGIVMEVNPNGYLSIQNPNYPESGPEDVGIPWVEKEASRRTASVKKTAGSDETNEVSLVLWSDPGYYSMAQEYAKDNERQGKDAVIEGVASMLEEDFDEQRRSSGLKGVLGDILDNFLNEVDWKVVAEELVGEYEFEEEAPETTASRRTASVMDESRLSAKDNTEGKGELYGDDSALRDQLKIRQKRKQAMKTELAGLLKQATALDRAGKHSEAKRADLRIESLYTQLKKADEAITHIGHIIQKKMVRTANAKPRMFFENPSKADADNPLA